MNNVDNQFLSQGKYPWEIVKMKQTANSLKSATVSWSILSFVLLPNLNLLYPFIFSQSRYSFRKSSRYSSFVLFFTLSHSNQ